MNNQEIINWLFEKAGPVIRYRTAIELMDTSIDEGKLVSDLLKAPKIEMLLKKAHELTPDEFIGISLYNKLHGMGLTLEGIMYRLLEFGLKKGIKPFDDVIAHVGVYVYNDEVQETVKKLGDPDVGYGKKYCVASLIYRHLLMGGYCNSDVISFRKFSIDSMYNVAKNMSTDIYVSDGDLAKYPSRSGKWVDKPVIRQECWSNCFNSSLPNIYELISMGKFPKEYMDDALRMKFDTIIKFVLDEQFQALPENFGLVFDRKKESYYSLGWRPNLPCFYNFDNEMDQRKIIFYVNVMSHFKAARDSDWFKQCMAHLEKFKTEKGTYCFPNHYLPNIEQSYYVNGTVMGLCENRRKKDAIEIESTFRMMAIKKQIQEN